MSRARRGRNRQPLDPSIHAQGVIFEFIPLGRYVRVCAVDEATLTEVSVVADATVSQWEMERVALSKLEWTMRGRPAPVETGDADTSDGAPAIGSKLDIQA